MPDVAVVLKANVSQAIAALGSVRTEMAATSAQGESLFASLNTHANKMALGTVAALGTIGVAVVKMAGDFQAGITTLVTGAGESQANLAAVSQGILDMAPKVATTTKALTDGMFMVESAGFHGADALKVLQAAAEGAKVGNADLGTVANAVTTVLNDYHLSASNAADVTSKLVETVALGKTHLEDMAASMAKIAPAAAATGVSMDDLLGAMATLTSQGTSADQAATYLRSTILRLAAPTNAAAAELASLGLTSAQVSESLGTQGITGTIKLLTDAIQAQMGPAGTVLIDNLKAAAVNSDLFDAAMGKIPQKEQSVIQALSDLTGGVRGLQAALELSGPSAATAAADVAKLSQTASDAAGNVQGFALVQQTLNFKLDQAKASIQVAAIHFGSVLIPPVAAAAGALSNLAQFVDKNSAAAAALAGLVTALLVPAIIRLAASLLGPLVEAIVGAVTGLYNIGLSAGLAAAGLTESASAAAGAGAGFDSALGPIGLVAGALVAVSLALNSTNNAAKSAAGTWSSDFVASAQSSGDEVGVLKSQIADLTDKTKGYIPVQQGLGEGWTGGIQKIGQLTGLTASNSKEMEINHARLLDLQKALKALTDQQDASSQASVKDLMIKGATVLGDGEILASDGKLYDSKGKIINNINGQAAALVGLGSATEQQTVMDLAAKDAADADATAQTAKTKIMTDEKNAIKALITDQVDLAKANQAWTNGLDDITTAAQAVNTTNDTQLASVKAQIQANTDLTQTLSDEKKSYDDVIGRAISLESANAGMSQAFINLNTNLGTFGQTVAQVKTAMDNLIGVHVSMASANADWAQQVVDLNKNLVTNVSSMNASTGAIDLTTQAGIDQTKMLASAATSIKANAQAMLDSGASTDQVNASVQAHITTLDKQLATLGLTADAIANVNAEFGLTPKDIGNALSANTTTPPIAMGAGGIDLSTQTGINQAAMISGVASAIKSQAQAMLDSGSSVGAVNAMVAANVGKLDGQLAKLGVLPSDVAKINEQFGLIPANISKALASDLALTALSKTETALSSTTGKTNTLADAQKNLNGKITDGAGQIASYATLLIDAGTPVDQIKDKIGKLVDNFDAELISIGKTPAEVDAYNKEFGLVKSDVNTNLNVAANVDDSALKTDFGFIDKYQQQGGSLILPKGGLATHATGGVITRGPALIGEGNPLYPEVVIPTDPAHRANAHSLMNYLAGHIPGLAGGGIVGGANGLGAFISGFGSAVNTTYQDLTNLASGTLTGATQSAFDGMTKTLDAVVAGLGGGATLLAQAVKYLGVPYVWGGGHGGAESVAQAFQLGLDCSGLVDQAAIAAGLSSQLFGTTREQQNAGVAVPNLAAAIAGDLVLFAAQAQGESHHVGIYSGDGMMLNAPFTGTVVRYDSVGVPQYIRRITGAGGGTGGSTGLNDITPGTGGISNPTDFANALLFAMGDPANSPNVTSLVNWENREGGNWHNTAFFNPLNTTQPESGSTPIPGNSAGVQAYLNWAQGITATRDTLNNGLYPDIDAALAAGIGLGTGHYAGLAKWSDGGYDHLAKGGIIGSFDQGGWLRPGLTMAYNGTGQPERVIGPNGGSGDVHVHIHGDVYGPGGITEVTRQVRVQLLKDRRSLVSLGLS